MLSGVDEQRRKAADAESASMTGAILTTSGRVPRTHAMRIGIEAGAFVIAGDSDTSMQRHPRAAVPSETAGQSGDKAELRLPIWTDRLQPAVTLVPVPAKRARPTAKRTVWPTARSTQPNGASETC